MNVQDFLSEWDAIRANSGLTNPEMQMTALQQWVIIRKDQAVQETKNKFWADIFTGIINSLREQIAKYVTTGKPDDPAVGVLQEMLTKLEEAMVQHRKIHGQDATT